MRVMIFHASAGHGHKKAADILAKALIEEGSSPEHITVEDALDYTPGWVKKMYTSIYYNIRF